MQPKTIDLHPERGSDRQTLSIREASEFSGWSRGKISKFIRAGELYAPLIRSRRCVSRAALETLMRCVVAEEAAIDAIRDALAAPVSLIRQARVLRTGLDAARREKQFAARNATTTGQAQQ